VRELVDAGQRGVARDLLHRVGLALANCQIGDPTWCRHYVADAWAYLERAEAAAAERALEADGQVAPYEVPALLPCPCDPS
jgi:hypothetical protein